MLISFSCENVLSFKEQQYLSMLASNKKKEDILQFNVLDYEYKKDKLVEYGRKVFDLNYASNSKIAKTAIEKTEKFFRKLGAKTRLSEYKISKKDLKNIAKKVMETSHGAKLGENARIGENEVLGILENAWSNYG